MTETIEEFEKRSYTDFPNKRVLVWKSAKLKKMPEQKASEVWDLETARNYLEYLKEQAEIEAAQQNKEKKPFLML